MSIDYEAFIGRGFMFGEEGNPSFEEYCAKVKIDPDEAYEIFEEEDMIIVDPFCGDYYFFGYRLTSIDLDGDFSFTKLNHFAINVEKEHKMEEKFNEVFGEYPPIFNTYMIQRAY